VLEIPRSIHVFRVLSYNYKNLDSRDETDTPFQPRTPVWSGGLVFNR